MGGSLSAVLSDLSTPIAYTKLDHTYVASDCGWVWRCWGAHKGGHALARGTGSSFLANCLSKPNGTAEIRYGIDGVCLQTANRILLPAKRRVYAARGYNISFTAYGHYGVKLRRGQAAWSRRLADCMGAASTSRLLADYEGVDRQRIVGKDVAMTDDAHGPSERMGRTYPGDNDLLGYMQDGGAIERVFGEAGFEPDKLIDRATFLSGY